jgi:hypothetical protein
MGTNIYTNASKDDSFGEGKFESRLRKVLVNCGVQAALIGWIHGEFRNEAHQNRLSDARFRSAQDLLHGTISSRAPLPYCID